MKDPFKEFIDEKNRLEKKYPNYKFEMDIETECHECDYVVGHSIFCDYRKKTNS